MALAYDTNQHISRAADGAGSSASVTIGAGADGATALINMFDGTSDTIATTLGGNAPTTSDQAIISGNRNYAAGWVGAALPAAGSQTLAWSGGDSGDTWNVALATWSGQDQTTPYNNFASIAPVAATPDAMNVTTSADGIAHALFVGNSNPTPGGTQIGEASGASGFANHQYKPGTGGAVSMDWTAAGTTYAIVGINVRAAAAPPAGGVSGQVIII